MGLYHKSSSRKPIGIFDSGIGGLTVAEAIRNLLPDEGLIYFGDTAHLPYGDKSPEVIRSYSERIAEYLLEKGCKIIVIACNTASSHAYNTLVEQVGTRAEIINVIDPVVAEVTGHLQHGRIGVIGTKGTIRSEVYFNRIKSINTGLDVVSLATPLLAPMIEEGFFNNKISRTIIKSYLERPKLSKINALILACTHYPLIKPEIEEIYGSAVEIIDSAEIVARHVKKYLSEHQLLNTGKKPPHHFIVSDFTESFAKSTRLFFKGKIKLEHDNIWL